MPPQADDSLQKLPPQNLEAEQMVLGAILIENHAMDLDGFKGIFPLKVRRGRK